MSHANGRVSISTLDEPEVELDPMSRDVRTGLCTDPKDLSPWPKYFYDAEGSRIFEEITDLPEYYQTRTESSILKRIAPELFDRTGCRELVELGSGAASDKTRALIKALLETDLPSRYVPFDVSESAVRESGDILLREYPSLRIQGYVGDFDKSLGALLGGSNERGGRLVIFLGGTIGNFTPDKRREFLSNISAGLIPGDHILIGMDLVKDPKVLEAAYDDASGTTARFNKNMLKVLNARLDADFDPDQFAHRATYNAEEQRIEMWLDAIQKQEVRFPVFDETVRFESGEGMRTEISTKFTADSAANIFEESDLHLLDLYTDDDNLFGLALGTKK
jgi:L-histidine N-alpha-methyltransferase